MMKNEMKCPHRRCQNRPQEVATLSLSELEKVLDNCTECEDGIIKSNQIAKKTADEIGALYALKFNQKYYKK